MSNSAGELEKQGDGAAAAGDWARAADAYDQALQADARNFFLALKLARTLLEMNEFTGAAHVIGHAQGLRPESEDLLTLKADFCRRAGDWAGLEAAAQDRLTKRPDDASAWRDLAAARFQTGRYAEAVEAFETALARGERDGEALGLYARMCIEAQAFDKAEAAIGEAERPGPASPALLSVKARLRTYQGRIDEAEECCRLCLAVDPERIEIYPTLSALRAGRLSEKEVEALTAVADRADVGLSARAASHYVLGHHYDAKADIDKAHAEYIRANALASERNAGEGIFFDAAGYDGWTERLIGFFKGAAAGSPEEGPAPIFIVGLPRCGSTLVESVLAAHSEIAAGGELAALPPLMQNWLKAGGWKRGPRLSDDERTRLSAAYFSRAPSTNGKRLTDKNLLNIESVGFIAELFPNAKIINMRRNPLEAGLSIYRHDLPKFWSFATKLEDIARRYGQYARLAAHWEKAYPDRFLTIQYETFAADFEGEARRLLAALGLPWESACGRFQSERGVAATTSAAQVRRPVAFKGGKASLYGDRLAVLRASLEAAHVDMETGAILS